MIGTVRGLAQHYVGGLERLEIWINKRNSSGLPYEVGRRIEVELVLGSRRYRAGVRATIRNQYIWICPDLKDAGDRRVKLASALKEAGLSKNQAVELKIKGNAVFVSPAMC